jgi:hypothetical protein
MSCLTYANRVGFVSGDRRQVTNCKRFVSVGIVEISYYLQLGILNLLDVIKSQRGVDNYLSKTVQCVLFSEIL